MTIHLVTFGEFLITRAQASDVLATISSTELPALDFAGVRVANHPFMDQLGKGLRRQLSLDCLNAISVQNVSPYIATCVRAGFATASIDYLRLDQTGNQLSKPRTTKGSSMSPYSRLHRAFDYWRALVGGPDVQSSTPLPTNSAIDPLSIPAYKRRAVDIPAASEKAA
jgi:hypothetical protein